VKGTGSIRLPAACGPGKKQQHEEYLRDNNRDRHRSYPA